MQIGRVQNIGSGYRRVGRVKRINRLGDYPPAQRQSCEDCREGRGKKTCVFYGVICRGINS